MAQVSGFIAARPKGACQMRDEDDSPSLCPNFLFVFARNHGRWLRMLLKSRGCDITISETGNTLTIVNKGPSFPGLEFAMVSVGRAIGGMCDAGAAPA